MRSICVRRAVGPVRLQRGCCTRVPVRLRISTDGKGNLLSALCTVCVASGRERGLVYFARGRSIEPAGMRMAKSKVVLLFYQPIKEQGAVVG